jgi:threonine aldolase
VAAAAAMRAVSGAVVSSKPVALDKAARVCSLFAASDASGIPADAGALVLCAAEAAAELHAFRRAAGAGTAGKTAENREKRRKKRRRAE